MISMGFYTVLAKSVCALVARSLNLLLLMSRSFAVGHVWFALRYTTSRPWWGYHCEISLLSFLKRLR